MLTLAGISYTELHDGSGEQMLSSKKDGNDAARVFRCAWADRLNLAIALMGYTTIVDGAWVRFPGQPHPSNAALYPSQIGISPLGKPSGENTWAHAKLTVKYEIPPFPDPSSTDPTDFISRKMRTSYEILQLDKFYETDSPDATDPAIPDGTIQIVIPKIEYDLTLHHVAEFPFQKVIGFMGGSSPTDKPKVNSTTFEGAAPGHLLFLGAEADEEVNSFGQKDLNVTYHFLWSPQDHRKDYDHATDSWLMTTHKITGNFKYDTADFNQLFYK